MSSRGSCSALPMSPRQASVCPEELASKLKLLFRGNEGDPLVEDAVYVVSPDRRHFPFKAATLTAAP